MDLSPKIHTTKNHVCLISSKRSHVTCYEAISINVTLKKSVSSVKNWRKNADGRSPGNEQSVVGGLKPIGLDRQMILIGELICSSGLALEKNVLVPNHGPLMNKAAHQCDIHIKMICQDIGPRHCEHPYRSSSRDLFFRIRSPKNTPGGKALPPRWAVGVRPVCPWDFSFGTNIPRNGEVRVR